jgi:hypothetical protein
MKSFASILSVLTLVFTLNVNAGAMSELLIAHTEGIQSEVSQWNDFSILTELEPRFVQASTGFDIAIESQIEVVQNQTHETFEVACTSYYKKDMNNNFNLVMTNCEYPE